MEIKILKKYKKEKEGNDCLITDYVYLINIDYNLYTVVHTRYIRGSWIENPIREKCKTFGNYSDALNCTIILANELKLEEV